MDRRNIPLGEQGYSEELKKESSSNIDLSREYVKEGDVLLRMPYRMIKKATFSDISKEELKDQPHAARLQYRLMLLEPVIKAYVNLVKGQITVIYNPVGADNIREKMSLKELEDFLAKEGIHVGKNVKDEDYDYTKEFYSYAFNPKRIREHPPYGMDEKEWKKEKQKLEDEEKKNNEHKWLKFKEWQERYKEEHKDVLGS